MLVLLLKKGQGTNIASWYLMQCTAQYVSEACHLITTTKFDLKFSFYQTQNYFRIWIKLSFVQIEIKQMGNKRVTSGCAHLAKIFANISGKPRWNRFGEEIRSCNF